MTDEPTTLEIDVEGGRLAALRWGSGPRVVLALHGITANAMSWRAVGRRMPADWSLVALDQRGRGRSRDLPGPYGVDDLARDARDAVVATGAEVLAGHSLGAYVALGTAYLHPGTAGRLVLVDGGVPLPVPAGADPDAVVQAVVGPSLERLRQRFADEDAYVEVFRAHPAMGPYWNDDVEAYARYDARVSDDGVRAAASPQAVQQAGRELVTRGEEIAAALAGLGVPAHLLTAARGMTDGPAPMLGDDLVAAALASTPLLRHTTVPDTNHYTVLVGAGAADVVAASVAASVAGD